MTDFYGTYDRFSKRTAFIPGRPKAEPAPQVTVGPSFTVRMTVFGRHVVRFSRSTPQFLPTLYFFFLLLPRPDFRPVAVFLYFSARATLCRSQRFNTPYFPKQKISKTRKGFPPGRYSVFACFCFRTLFFHPSFRFFPAKVCPFPLRV